MSEFDAQGGAVANKTQSKLKLRATTLALAAGLTLSGLPLVAQAAGLGKVTVLSALGQPLRAEVELSASKEELASMKASLASQEAFRAAGLDYATPLLGIKFAIDKRPGGQSVIRLTSDRAINEPFLDMLLELNWSSGRLVREYTFLLDPPEVAAKAASPVAAPEVRAAAAKSAEKAAAPAPVAAEPATRPVAKPRVSEAPAGERKPESRTESEEGFKVKQGDTLRKVAQQNAQEGVSLDQMLVGLFRANKEAFDGGNMNRLKAGKILSVPQKAELESVSEAEARKIVVAQAADWNAYRRKLAGTAAQSPAADDAGKQEAAGKITAKVEEKAAPAAEAKDQVRVSKTETGKGKPGAKASEDELVAKEKALKEANERLASLEKNVGELQKLLELKNQNLAELQKQANAKAPEAKKPEPAPAAKPVEAAKPAEPPKPVESPKVAEAPKPAEPPKVEEKKAEPAPAEAAKPAEQPKAEEKPADAVKVEEKRPEEPPKPAEAPKPKPKAVIPPPEPEEPGFIEELLGNPAMLGGLGGAMALGVGYFLYKRRKPATGEKPIELPTSLSQPSLGENSVFRNTGGQSVDTSHTPPQTDFSQAGPGTIDTDEVDPVAEADVYMAYGRDAQAEEILLEAKNKDPKRYAIHLKLLEIYANRQSVKQFETLASDLYSETGGVGADWEKAAAMGLKLDPQNPLFGGSGKAAEAPAFDSDATVIVSAANVRNTVTMPGQLAQMAAAAESSAEVPQLPAEPEPVAAEAEAPMSLDFDLGPAATTAAAETVEAEVEAVKPDLVTTLTRPEALSMDDSAGGLDFDLGTGDQPAVAEAPALDLNMPEIKVGDVADDIGGLDFDLGLTSATAEPPAAPALAEPPAAPAANPDLVLDVGNIDTDALEFDVKLTESTVLGQPAPSSFDMGAISLDLSAPAPADTGFEVAQAATVVNPELAMSLETQTNLQAGGGSEEVATKLDLAKAYEEMGDLEGARELLQEVLKEGSAEQQAAAQAVLARVS